MNKIYYANFVMKRIAFECDTEKNNICTDVIHDKIQRLVSDSGITTSRKNPNKIEVKVTVLKPENGQLVEKDVKVYKIQPPLARMTEVEFTEEQCSLLDGIPYELRDAFTQYAWEHGHSSGYEEVINYLQELVSEFKPAIDKLINRVKLCSTCKSPSGY